MKPVITYPTRSNPIRYHQGPGGREQGSVLVISLLILLIMSLLSVTSVNNAVLEEKMAANSRNSQLAFQAAESALRQAEKFIGDRMNANKVSDTGAVVDMSCTNGLCDCDNRDTFSNGGSGAGVNGCPVEYWTDSGVDAWNSGYRLYVGNLPNGNQAKFIIEYMGKTQPTIAVLDPRTCGTCPNIYRITALGENVNSGARVMLQTTFRKD